MVGEVIADRYELEELVEHGGMSTVYRGRDRLLERTVALKVLHPHFLDDPEYVERFRREARAVAQLSHPHIVGVIDRGQADGQQFIVFEYVEGENLKQLLERSGPLPVSQVIELGTQIADALAFAHAHGLVHRDVKPQNVLLDHAGDAKVTDFGIARSLDVEHGFTQTGTVLGTSNYLSPEQAAGAAVTPATDVYSLGVVLYELLAGEVPFHGDNLVAVAMKHVTEHAPSLLDHRTDIPPRLARAVERALEKHPDSRFPSMDAFATELRRCRDELGDPDAEPTAVRSLTAAPVIRRRAPRRPGRLPLALALAGTLILAAVIALLALGGSGATHHRGGGSPAAAVRLQGVGDYDPQGDGGEHGYTAKYATDGNASTYWDTERYASRAFGNLKSGLGLVLKTRAAVKLRTLTVDTTTPGFTAQVRVGNSPNGPFVADSSVETVRAGTTFTLNGKTAQYWVLWLTYLPPGNYVRVSEVRAG